MGAGGTAPRRPKMSERTASKRDFARKRTIGRYGGIAVRVPARLWKSAGLDQRHNRLVSFLRSNGRKAEDPPASDGPASDGPLSDAAVRAGAYAVGATVCSGAAAPRGGPVAMRLPMRLRMRRLRHRCALHPSLILEDARSHAPSRPAFRSIYFFRLPKGETFRKVACSSNTLIYTP